MSGHVDVRLRVPAPLPAVWRIANDPRAWAAGGHPARNLTRDGQALRFEVSSPPGEAGRSVSYRVERILDEVHHTVYSRRYGSPDFRYSHVWFSYTPDAGGTEMRCVVDFEMLPAAGVSDDAMAAAMERGLATNMERIADMVRQEGQGSPVETARELADRVWRVVESGELHRLAELFDERCEFSTSAGSGQGIGYVEQVFARHMDGYPDLSHEIADCVESADGSAAALRMVFRGRNTGELRGPVGTIAPTGRPLEWRSSDHVRVRDGRITSWHAHFDRLSILDQLGMLDRLRPAAADPAASKKATLRRVLDEVFGHGRLGVLDELLTADFVNHRTPPGVGGDIEGLRQIVRLERQAFPDLSYTVEREVAEGDLVIQVAVAEGTHLGPVFGVEPTGRRVQWRQVHIVRMEGDRMAEHWGVSDLAALWVQIGRVVPIERVASGT